MQATEVRRVFKGTIAKLAIQCTDPDSGEVGCFLFTGDSHRIEGSRCSPVFDDLVPLFNWTKDNAWEERSIGVAMHYRKI